MKDVVMEIVGQHFRPEFIGRIDELVVFSQLFRENIRMICSKQMQQLGKRIAECSLELVVSDDVLD
jgi:ATP-dependent Clp protease ATP-binding subunit ClpB